MKTLFLTSVMLLFAALAVAMVAIAKDGDKKFLDAKSVRALISSHNIESKKIAGGSGYAYWEWKSGVEVR